MAGPAYDCTSSRPRQELLEYILGIYPILESILSYSHRPSIMNLARTCHSLRSILTATVGPLSKPFSICTERLNSCALCHITLCIACGEDTIELPSPAVLLSDDECIYTVLGACSPELHEALRMATERAMQDRDIFFLEVISLEVIKQASEDTPQWAGRTIPNPETPGKHEIDPTRRLVVMEIKWEDVPHADNACTCLEFNPACEASVHLVRVKCGLVKGALSVFAWVPLSLRGRVAGGGQNSPFILDMPPLSCKPQATLRYHEVLEIDN
ncbi:hypothetical protein BGX38DRAFT_1178878 [Terfezia claveryi]|nr:hypothetical protein BGX38DRAFT_1178878 [Terfezia claveryi]